jgi:D-psicose/D-tagatose/L-ribulose 3-epimerase
MKLAVSNIAWTNEEEPAVAELLKKLGVQYIEIAPTKKWEDPTLTSSKDIETYKAFWEFYGIQVVAFQSMLFNRPALKLFENEENRQATLEYLRKFIRLADDFGAGVMVFGSPKNRQRHELPIADAEKIAIPFFDQLGQVAQAHNTVFCIEPNAPQYDCDFITDAQSGISIVRSVNNPGFGLHLDIACMTLAGDNVGQSIHDAEHVLRHFHISAPYLGQVEDRADVDYQGSAQALRDINYEGYVSIEMRPEGDNNIERVERAVQFAQRVYKV